MLAVDHNTCTNESSSESFQLVDDGLRNMRARQVPMTCRKLVEPLRLSKPHLRQTEMIHQSYIHAAAAHRVIPQTCALGIRLCHRKT